MPGDKRDADSWEESGFGLGSGMIDPGMRADGALPVEQEMWLIKSRPQTFGGSELGLPGGVRPEVIDVVVPRLLPGETELDRE